MNAIKKAILGSLVGSAIVGIGMPAHAYDGIKTGTIATVQVGPSGNFNIWLTGNPTLCTAAGGDQTEGIIAAGTLTVTADGQKALLSTATAAYLSGRNVRVYATNVGSWCGINVIDLIP